MDITVNRCEEPLTPNCHPPVFLESHVCLTDASQNNFLCWGLRFPSFFREWTKKRKLCYPWSVYPNPVYDLIMTTRSRSYLVVIELFLAAGEIRVKSILLRKLKQA